MRNDLRVGALLALTASAAFVLAACKGEDRPNVEVIGGADTVSVSASSLGPSEPAGGPSSPAGSPGAGGSAVYTPSTNPEIYFQMAADLRDIRTAIAATPPDWTQARNIYEQGKNQVNATTGALRPLASLHSDAVDAVFPNGNSVYGRPLFINALINDGLAGTGRAAGLPDDARRQIIDKGVQMLFYGKALQEFQAAKTRMDTGAANAAAAVDETYAILAGIAEGTNRPHSLFNTAASRERDFKLEGKLVAPLESALAAALAAAQRGDKAAFDKAFSDGKGHINAIFYLGALRYAKALEADSTTAARQVHLAEGWTFWQAIRATAASGSSSAAGTIESAFTRDPNTTWTAADTTRVYNALNDTAVLQALGIPAVLQVKTPPSP